MTVLYCTVLYYTGVTVLRQVVPRDWVRLLQRGVRDLVMNNTLHCNLAYFNGPPILHRYSFTK